MGDNVVKIPTANDRGFFRVDGQVYLHSEVVDASHGIVRESPDGIVPTFEQDESDFVGLSIDAFREDILNSDIEAKDHFLKIQQLLSMLKMTLDAERNGRKQKVFRKLMVNISGSGMCFPSHNAYDKDTLIKVTLFFPRFPFKCVSLLSTVIRSEKADAGYEVKVQFKEMSEKNQDDVLRFVNQCQRDSRHGL